MGGLAWFGWLGVVAVAREVGMMPERGQAGMCACPGPLAY